MGVNLIGISREAIRLLKQGCCVTRLGWDAPEKFVCKQVPATIDSEILPKMQSLPGTAKELILQTKGSISYENQCLIYNCITGIADSWLPTSTDLFAEDWVEVVTNKRFNTPSR